MKNKESRVYRLLMNINCQGNNEKIVTEDTFRSKTDAGDAILSVVKDLKSKYGNLQHKELQLFDQAKTQDDGINYIGNLDGNFDEGNFFIRIIVDESTPVETISIQENSGRFMELNINTLGEFKFLFKPNILEDESQKKWQVEVLWNPPQYGIIDFIVGYYVDDIDEEVERIRENMDYFIDGARVACECHIDDGSDDEGVYEEILESFFNKEYKQEDIIGNHYFGTTKEFCATCFEETEMIIQDFQDIINLECTECHIETEMAREDFEPIGNDWFLE